MSQVWSNTGSQGVMRPGGIGNKAFSTKIKNKINLKGGTTQKNTLCPPPKKNLFNYKITQTTFKKSPQSISRLFQSPGKYHD